MFDINKIPYNRETGQYICICQCASAKDADDIRARYLGISRQFDITGNMYIRGTSVIISAFSKRAVANIASYINANYFTPPLDVYVFYGSSQTNLDSRWCVGFNFSNTVHLIEALNMQGPLIHVDSHPESWRDNNGRSYSVVMLTGITDQQLTKETIEPLNQMVTLCCEAIRNTTFRETNPVIVQ